MLSSLWDLEDLRSALFSDALDSLGHRSQVLGADITALTTHHPVAGRAYTIISELADIGPPRCRTPACSRPSTRSREDRSACSDRPFVGRRRLGRAALHHRDQSRCSRRRH